MARIPLDKWAAWWAGADRRIMRAFDGQEKNPIKRKYNSLYDMGQNLDLVLEWKLGIKDVNWLEIPGHENCSGMLASIYDSGQAAIQGIRNLPFKDLPHVHETADVIPGHAGMSKYFKRLEPGQPIRAGCAKLNMNYDEPHFGIDEIFMKILTTFLLIRNPVLMVMKLYKETPELFHDAIKVTGRDRFAIPSPYHFATHAEFIRRNDNGILSIVSQELFLREYSVEQDRIYANMEGDRPANIIMEPNFLYG